MKNENDYTKYYKYILAGVLTFLLVISFVFNIVMFNYYKKNHNKKVYSLNKVENEIKYNNKTNDTVFVDIKGEVKYPGVYEIEEGKRVIDLVHMSGGLTKFADTTYVNLSKILEDEDVVRIYKYSPKIESSHFKTKSYVKSNTKNDESNNVIYENESKEDIININTASIEELSTLSGIGESKAKDIVKYRDKNNGFNNIEEIMNVKGIGNSTFEKIKEHITT